MTLPVAILAGGLATRLGELAHQTPKALLPLAGEPFAFHQLRLLAANGVRQVVFCVGHLGASIQQRVGDGARFGLRVDYSHDGDQLLGTGGALRNALALLPDEFMVLYGDSYLDCRYGEVEEAFHRRRKPGLMTVFRNENQWDRSNILYGDGLILAYEKSTPVPGMLHIDYGLSVFRAEVFSGPTYGNRFDLGEVFRNLIARGELAGLELRDRFYEIGSPGGLAELDALLRRNRAEAAQGETGHGVH